MNETEEIKKFIVEQFELIDEHDQVYVLGDLTYYFYFGKGKSYISFACTESGWYGIYNPTLEQIKNVVDIFNVAEFGDAEDSVNLKKHYGGLLLKKFAKFLEEEN